MPGIRDKPVSTGSQGGLAGPTPEITNINDDGSVPAAPVPNFKLYNNFRSGDLAPPDGTDTPDLAVKLPEPCTLQCGDGTIVLNVHIGNEGASPLTAGATITVAGVVKGQMMMLGSLEVVDVIDAGKVSSAYPFALDATDLESVTVTVDAKELECKLGNNAVTLMGPFCN